MSGLTYNVNFFCGYSPERINPGDKEHTITKIKKVTSGSTPDVAKKIDELYKSIIVAGTHFAPSIKVAEAAKVIENSQRDINIAFINELSKIFNKIGIRTKDILDATATNKTNIDGFLNMLIAAKDSSSLKKMVFAASSSTSRDSEVSPKVEGSRRSPTLTIGSHKTC